MTAGPLDTCFRCELMSLFRRDCQAQITTESHRNFQFSSSCSIFHSKINDEWPPCQLLAANSWRFLFAHICRNSLFIICSLQNSSYCLLSTISGIFTINALLQQHFVPFHFDKQASSATSSPTIFFSKTINVFYAR